MLQAPFDQKNAHSLSNSELLDVAVIGAGFAGVPLAYTLAKAGRKVALIDGKERYGFGMRAEKIEQTQVARMRRLGLLDYCLPGGTRVEKIQIASPSGIETEDPGEQYGLYYAETVNEMRDAYRALAETSSNASWIVDMATELTEGPQGERILKLRSGKILRARLVVFAGGMASKPVKGVEFEFSNVSNLNSYTVGFSVEAAEGALKFDALNYETPSAADGVDYVSFFRFGPEMRVNLFTHWKADDPRTRALREQPLDYMEALLPGVSAVTGPMRLTSKVIAFPTTYRRLRSSRNDGVVCISDLYQTVSPSTGMGLEKALADVEILATQYVPDWLGGKNTTVSHQQIAGFYVDPEKRKIDDHARAAWVYYRDRRKERMQRYAARLHISAAHLLSPSALARVEQGMRI